MTNPLLKYFRNRALRRMFLLHLPLLMILGSKFVGQIQTIAGQSRMVGRLVWTIWPATVFSTGCVVLLSILGLWRQGARIADPTRHPSLKALADGPQLTQLLERVQEDLINPSVPPVPFVAGGLLVADLQMTIKMDRLDRVRWLYPKTTEKHRVLVFVSDDNSKIETPSFSSDEVRDLFVVEVEPHLKGAVLGYDAKLDELWKQHPSRWIKAIGTLGKVVAPEAALELAPSLAAKKES